MKYASVRIGENIIPLIGIPTNRHFSKFMDSKPDSRAGTDLKSDCTETSLVLG